MTWSCCVVMGDVSISSWESGKMASFRNEILTRSTRWRSRWTATRRESKKLLQRDDRRGWTRPFKWGATRQTFWFPAAMLQTEGVQNACTSGEGTQLTAQKIFFLGSVAQSGAHIKWQYTSVNLYQSTRCYNPEDGSLHIITRSHLLVLYAHTRTRARKHTHTHTHTHTPVCMFR
jgi:hypothetical protein